MPMATRTIPAAQIPQAIKNGIWKMVSGSNYPIYIDSVKFEKVNKMSLEGYLSRNKIEPVMRHVPMTIAQWKSLNRRKPKWEQYSTYLECDGMARIISYELRILKIEHKVMYGFLETGLSHWWIEIGDVVIDYSARRWLEKCSHGVFFSNQSLHKLEGELDHTGIKQTHEIVYRVLLDPIPVSLLTF